MALTLFAPYETSFRWCGVKHGVPSWLMKGMGHETSHFRADAMGPTADRGVMQVIESNAAGCGIAVSDLLIPSKNICCAAWLMNRNIERVKSYGATGDDALLIALYRNNMGGGNTDSIVAAGGTTWEAFKAMTTGYPSKHQWVEQMWDRAQSYRWGEYFVNVVLLLSIGSITYLALR